MKTTGSQKVKIGLFTFSGILVLVLAIFLLGKQKSLFNSTIDVYGMFNNVNGLQVGNNVRFAGINVGVVDNIQIITDSTIRVDLTLNDNVIKFIKIAPGGVTSTQQVQSGDQLTAVNPFDIDRIIKKLTGIADNAGNLIQNLSEITGKVNSGKGSLGRLLNNDKIANDLDATVQQAQNTMKNVHKTTTTLNEDLTAAQHNILLKGFFNKKKKAEKARKDSIKKAQEAAGQK
jgi:phospholipid/cholesterol/gamma-HCH transport system substrate-binding protein